MCPSKTNKFCISVYFKKPNTQPASKKVRIEEEDMQDTTIGSQSEDLDDHDLSLQDTQPDTVEINCTDLHPKQPQLHSLDIGTISQQ